MMVLERVRARLIELRQSVPADSETMLALSEGIEEINDELARIEQAGVCFLDMHGVVVDHTDSGEDFPATAIYCGEPR